jgi:hypothetical protein
MSKVRNTAQIEPLASTVDSLLQKLRTSFAAASSKLESERAALEEESQAIQAASDELKLLLPAKAREAARAADQLLLEGKGEEAQAKRDEQQQAERAPAEMEQRRRAIAVRIGEIDLETRDTARRVFQEWFPGLRAALVAEQRTLCEALDTAWAGVQRFALETGTQEGRPPLVSANLRTDLTARETGPEKTTFLRLLDWFGGRR